MKVVFNTGFLNDFYGRGTLFQFVDGYNEAVYGSGAKRLKPTARTRQMFSGKAIPFAEIYELRGAYEGKSDHWLAGFWFGCDAAINDWSKRILGRAA